MNRSEALEKALKLVDEVLEDQSKLDSALDQWPEENLEDRNLLESTRWQITYINNDADIRENEPDYEMRQLEYLRFLREKINQRLKAIGKNI